MIKEFLLIDDSDENFQELITFENEIRTEDIEKVIENVRDSLQGEYTNEDIYEALDGLGNYEQKELFDIPRFYF